MKKIGKARVICYQNVDGDFLPPIWVESFLEYFICKKDFVLSDLIDELVEKYFIENVYNKLSDDDYFNSLNWFEFIVDVEYECDIIDESEKCDIHIIDYKLIE